MLVVQSFLRTSAWLALVTVAAGTSLPLVAAADAPAPAPAPSGNHSECPTLDESLPIFSEQWIIFACCAIACVVGAAMAAGLTMGLVSLADEDLTQIQLMEEEDCDTEDERRELRQLKRYAKKLLPLKSNHHLLLVTLLLVNAGVNEALPIFLDRLVPYPWMAILLSVSFVLVFGEIIPSAIFTGPQQLKIAAGFACLVRTFRCILLPISWPIAKCLDACLHEDSEMGAGRYKRARLKALLRHHKNINRKLEQDKAMEKAADFLGITEDQLDIMQGALDLRTTTCGAACIPLDKVFMLPSDAKMDANTMADIMAKGFSRVPVYDKWPHNVVGLILVKRLIVLNPEDARSIKDFLVRKPVVVGLQTSLLDALNEFQEGRAHMAIVCDSPELVRRCLKESKPVPVNVHMAGIITIEDVIERIIKEEIADETEETRFQSLRNPLSSYTVSQRAFRLGRLARLKSFAAVLKQRARSGSSASNQGGFATGEATLSTAPTSESQVEVQISPGSSTSMTTPLLSSGETKIRGSHPC